MRFEIAFTEVQQRGRALEGQAVSVPHGNVWRPAKVSGKPWEWKVVSFSSPASDIGYDFKGEGEGRF